MLTGPALIADINAFEPRANEAGVWWLGQHGFALKVAGKVVYVDAFLSEMQGRTVAPLLQSRDVTNADVICGTHDHADHIDRGAWPGMAAASPGAVFVIPALHGETLPGELNIAPGRFVGLDDGTSAEVRGVKFTGVAAAHELLEPDPATGRHAFLGLVIEANGFTFYHAGDTCIYEGLATKLKAWQFDVAFLPINGRDAKRYRQNILGNMTYQEAADLAGHLRPRLTIPAHYEMFALNSVEPGLFVDYYNAKYPALRTALLPHGERFVYSRG